jgi:hypothetical protein
MRRDAELISDPEKFNLWAKGGESPYKNELFLRTHFFVESRELWKPGKPEMTTKELILKIMEEKKLKITQ